MPQITPYLWFDHQADEAMAFYTSIFDDSRIGHVERYPDESLDPHFAGMHGKVIMGSFQLRGQPFLCLDGGPHFPINPAISFYCTFDDPAAIGSAWQRLSQDGKVLMAFQSYPWAPAYGWVQDRLGVSWQLALTAGSDWPPQRITPMLMFTGPAAGRAERAMGHYTTMFDASGIDTLVAYEEQDGDTPGLVKHARFHLGGGSERQCGWCKDSFGVSWQIIPANMGALLSTGPAAVQAMMHMRKINIAELERAGQGQ